MNSFFFAQKNCFIVLLTIFIFHVQNIAAKCDNYNLKEKSYVQYKTNVCLLSNENSQSAIYYEYECSNNVANTINKIFYSDANCSQILLTNNNNDNILDNTKYNIDCNATNNNNNNNNNANEECEYMIIENKENKQQDAIVINECSLNQNDNFYYQIQCNNTHYWYLQSASSECLYSNNDTYNMFNSSLYNVIECSKISSLILNPIKTTDVIYLVPDYDLTLIPPSTSGIDTDYNVSYNNVPATTTASNINTTDIIFLVPDYDLTLIPPNMLDNNSNSNSNSNTISGNNENMNTINNVTSSGVIAEQLVVSDENDNNNNNNNKNNNNNNNDKKKRKRLSSTGVLVSIIISIIIFAFLFSLVFYFIYHFIQAKKHNQTFDQVVSDDIENNINSVTK